MSFPMSAWNPSPVFGGMSYNPITGRLEGPPSAGNTVFGDPSRFARADTRQTSDYDAIMQGYKDVSSSLTPYSTPSDVTSSLGQLNELSTTGGYSPEAIADIRERGISPIRSIYANAQANINRQRNLQGGYSPNYTAATAKLARDESSQIADQVTSVNAQIAQNQAQNRIAAASPYASAAGSEAGRQLQSQEFMPQIKAGLLEGQNRLYGTTPALTNMFGGQVAEAARLSQGQQDLNMRNQQIAANIIGSLSRGFGG